MIPIATYYQYWKDLLPYLTNITRVVPVAQVDDIVELIKGVDLDEIFLAVVIPSFDSDAQDADNLRETGETLILVLQKKDRRNLTLDDIVSVMADTQEELMKIRTRMLADKGNCSTIMRHLNLASFHTDPEYDFTGCYGWNMSFTLADMNFINE